MSSCLNKIRARIAQKIAPPKQPEAKGDVERFVAVRWFIPGVDALVEIYDRQKPSDLAAWDENQSLYPCQVIGYAACREALALEPSTSPGGKHG